MLGALAVATGLWLAAPAGAAVLLAKGGVVRVLDRLSGAVSDLDLAAGQMREEGRLSIQLDECRYPSDQPAGEAFAHLTITDKGQLDPVFKGWMVASSPALSALDHPRYDVWVLHCDVPAAAAAPDAAADAPADSGN